MPSFPNKYPGSCAVCGLRVAAQSGTTQKVSGKWTVYCAEHDPGKTTFDHSTQLLSGERSEPAGSVSPARASVPNVPLAERDSSGSYVLLSGHTASSYQSAVFDHFRSGSGSRIIRAVAGSGKTTTMKNAIRFLPDFCSVQMLAFNTEAAAQLKDAIEELKQRTGRSFAFTDAGTFHSVGMRALRSYLNLPNSQIKVKSNKTRWLFRDKLAENANSTLLRHQNPQYVENIYSSFCTKLVGLAKGEGLGALVPGDRAAWQKLIDHHGLYLESNSGEISHAIDLSMALLDWSNAAARLGSLDFDDMLYLISLWNIALPRNEIVICDEAQDTNPVRRAMLHLLLADGGRLYAVGDEKQSIYGFTGATTDAMDQIAADFSCEALPLTVCYRCARSIVLQAQTWVNYIEPAPQAPEGEVCFEKPLAETLSELTPLDAILCRNTAPLVSVAYRLISSGVGCRILGREIGAGLVGLIEQQKTSDLDEMLDRLAAWAEKETTRFIKKGEEIRADALMDRVECINIISEALGSQDRTVAVLTAKIETMFSDQADGLLTLCTIHKAKGKEWPTVAILRPDLMPSKSARQEWQLEQENNLCYVAATRAQNRLIYTASGDMDIGTVAPTQVPETRSMFEKPLFEKSSKPIALARLNLTDLI
jgi:DNA helicase-2/ATP-dependent DNA helicase PcrA